MTHVSRPVLVAWVVLVAATCLSWWLGTDHGFSSEKAAAVVVLVVAFVKIRLIASEFMDLRHAPRRLGLAFDAYAVVVLAALVAMYLAA